jgi:IS1 family transposase
MIPQLFYYQLVVVGLLWLCVMLHAVWPSRGAEAQPRPAEAEPLKPKRKRSSEPLPFAGLTHKPPCARCAQEAVPPPAPPPVPPEPMPPTHRRPRTVDTSRHFCPHAGCRYRGWLGWGHRRANGHPHGGPWRQCQCTSCRGDVPEHHGTICHGKRVSPALLVWAVGPRAEGLGIRAVARVFEVAPNTALQWLVEAAEHLQAFAPYFLHDMRVTPVQLDELFALLSAVQAGEVSEAEAITRLSRSPPWGWVAMDPVSKLLLAIDVGSRPLAMAQRVVHQVVQVLAPSCLPLFLTDGFKEYTTALLTHYGQWVQVPRRQAPGPAPKPRWMPLPELLCAPVVKTVRRRRLVGVQHRVVFGTIEAVNQVLRPLGWQINTAFVERINLSLRQHGAAIGRRVTTLCKGEEGVRQQLVLCQGSHNFCVPHASLRLPLAALESTNGTGSAKRWGLQTPAMAAGLTDHVWSVREVLLFRVPPWPQPAGR